MKLVVKPAGQPGDTDVFFLDFDGTLIPLAKDEMYGYKFGDIVERIYGHFLDYDDPFVRGEFKTFGTYLREMEGHEPKLVTAFEEMKLHGEILNDIFAKAVRAGKKVAVVSGGHSDWLMKVFTSMGYCILDNSRKLSKVSRFSDDLILVLYTNYGDGLNPDNDCYPVSVYSVHERMLDAYDRREGAKECIAATAEELEDKRKEHSEAFEVASKDYNESKKYAMLHYLKTVYSVKEVPRNYCLFALGDNEGPDMQVIDHVAKECPRDFGSARVCEVETMEYLKQLSQSLNPASLGKKRALAEKVLQVKRIMRRKAASKLSLAAPTGPSEPVLALAKVDERDCIVGGAPVPGDCGARVGIAD